MGSGCRERQVCLVDYLSLSRLWDESRVFRFVFAKCGVFRSFWGQMRAELGTKRA